MDLNYDNWKAFSPLFSCKQLPQFLYYLIMFPRLLVYKKWAWYLGQTTEIRDPDCVSKIQCNIVFILPFTPELGIINKMYSHPLYILISYSHLHTYKDKICEGWIILLKKKKGRGYCKESDRGFLVEILWDLYHSSPSAEWKAIDLYIIYVSLCTFAKVQDFGPFCVAYASIKNHGIVSRSTMNFIFVLISAILGLPTQWNQCAN